MQEMWPGDEIRELECRRCTIHFGGNDRQDVKQEEEQERRWTGPERSRGNERQAGNFLDVKRNRDEDDQKQRIAGTRQ
jgi:hypothetical protein